MIINQLIEIDKIITTIRNINSRRTTHLTFDKPVIGWSGFGIGNSKYYRYVPLTYASIQGPAKDQLENIIYQINENNPSYPIVDEFDGEGYIVNLFIFEDYIIIFNPVMSSEPAIFNVSAREFSKFLMFCLKEYKKDFEIWDNL